jgi:DNA-binding GntR family transcriptional regulator
VATVSKETKKNKVAELAPDIHEIPSFGILEIPSSVQSDDKPESSVDHVVASLLRGLYNGEFSPGEKLTEADLTRRFGVARGSVREALRRLAAEGLVIFNRHQGARIRLLGRGDASDTLEVIEFLSGLSARLAAERISLPEDNETLKEAMVLLTEASASGNLLNFGRARDRFYRVLARISRNRQLMRLIPTIQAHLIRVQFHTVYDAGSERQRIDEYREILTAIANGDSLSAELCMRRHVRSISMAIAGLPDSYFAS